MGELKRIGDLQVDQDMTHQRREWRAERIGWVLMALLVVAALAGLLGQGPLSRASAGDPASLQAQFYRFERDQGPTDLDLQVAPQAVRDGQLRLSLGRGFVERIQIQRISPEPVSVAAGDDGLVYSFDVADATQPIAVEIAFEPTTIGALPVRISTASGERLQFTQFVFP